MIELKLNNLSGVVAQFSTTRKNIPAAMRLALNDGLRFAGREGSRAIRKEVNFKRNYLTPSTDKNARLRIAKQATNADLEASLIARDRATSLARFATSTPTFGKQARPVRVKVGLSGSRSLRYGFFVRLKKGASLTEDQFNTGVALRVRPGETLKNKRLAGVPFGKDAYLLYGPSVAQVFETVSKDIEPTVADFAASEFDRQLTRLSRG